MSKRPAADGPPPTAGGVRPQQPTSSHQPLLFADSDKIEDRTSVFVARYSRQLTAKELQASEAFEDATHKMAAWRKPSKQRSLREPGTFLYETGYDDDGESYAGKKLAKVLEEMNVEGAVVCARWYGGVLLGPVRFSHIENCARQAIRRYLSGVGQGPDGNAKRRKVEDDPQEKARLIEELKYRDSNILVLRDLLKEKLRDSSDDNQGATAAAATPSQKTPDYAKMTAEALRRLDRARDATVAYLLKQIQDAEAKVATVEVKNVDQNMKPTDSNGERNSDSQVALPCPITVLEDSELSAVENIDATATKDESLQSPATVDTTDRG